MYQVVNYDQAQRKDAFLETAEKMKLNEAVVEKNYWACFILDYFFHQNEYSTRFSFRPRGLNEPIGAMKRFSEDLKLNICLDDLGYENLEGFIKKEFLPKAQNYMRQKVKETVEVSFQKTDTSILCFRYPKVCSAENVSDQIEIMIYQ